MDIGLGFDGSQQLAEVLALTRAAERSGWDSAWFAEHLGLHDGIVTATAAAMSTDRLRLGIVGPAVASRHPALLSMELCSLAELAGDRVRVQVGLGDPTLMAKAGQDTLRSPLRVVRTFVETLRGIVGGTEMTGTVGAFEVNEFRLAFPVPVPIDIMAIRPKMRQLAADIADGISFTTGVPRSYLLAACREARERAGERDLRLTAFAYAGIADTMEEARVGVARKLSYLPPQLLLDLAGDVEGMPDLRALHAAGAGTGSREAVDLLATPAIDSIALVATRRTIADALGAYEGTGLDELALFLAVPRVEREQVVATIGAVVAESPQVASPVSATKRGTTTLDGGVIRWSSIGDTSAGAPLVLLHGINSRAAHWSAVARRLSEVAAVIALDYRGHGRSDRFGPYDLDAYVADAAAVLVEAGVSRCHLIGTSFGGPVAVRLASRHRELGVLSVTAVGSAARIGTGPDGEAAVRSLRDRGVRDFFEHVMPRVSLARGTDEAILADVIDTAASNDEDTVAQILTGAFGPDVSADARSLGLPGQVITGQFDRTCPPASGREFAALLGVPYTELPGVGHMPMLESPDALAELIIRATHPLVTTGPTEESS